MPVFAKVFLPAGKIGVAFTGCPPQVSRLHFDSPLQDKLFLGQIVEKLVIPGHLEACGLSSSELCSLLTSYHSDEGRILVLQDLDHPSASHAQVSAIATPRFSTESDHVAVTPAAPDAQISPSAPSSDLDGAEGETGLDGIKMVDIPELPTPPIPAAPPCPTTTGTLPQRRGELQTYLKELKEEKRIHKEQLTETIDMVTEAFQRLCCHKIDAVTRESGHRLADTVRRIEAASKELERHENLLTEEETKQGKLMTFMTQHDEDDYSDDIPSSLRCPITLSLMKDPVVAADGNTYDRQALINWINKCQLQDGKPVSPLMGTPLEHTLFFPVHSLKDLCQQFALKSTRGEL